MPSATTATQVRPANRRELIADAAGRAFSARGYHAVAMSDIAADVDIAVAALYRHFPNKYALFVHCATQLADGLVATLDQLPRGAGLDQMLDAIAATAVANRATGGSYRWESRYLAEPDRRALRAAFGAVVERVGTAIRTTRDSATSPRSTRLLASATLGAIGSATAHRTSVGARRMEGLLAGAAYRVALARIVPRVAPERRVRRAGRLAAAGGRREQIIAAAVALFHRDGYAEVSMAQLAAEVGLTPSGLYRHFAGKAEILVAACLQASDVLAAAVDGALATARGPADAVRALATAYVGYSFEHTALTSVASAESGGLPAHLQRPVRAAQRTHITIWEQRLRAARPELDQVDARVLVHAGLGVVTEAGRALRWADSPTNRAQTVVLVGAALGVAASVRGPGRGRRSPS